MLMELRKQPYAPQWEREERTALPYAHGTEEAALCSTVGAGGEDSSPIFV
jgi:hypothetical protein